MVHMLPGRTEERQIRSHLLVQKPPPARRALHCLPSASLNPAPTADGEQDIVSHDRSRTNTQYAQCAEETTLKRIAIVSTYRNRGTRNIGDRLIAHSLRKILDDNYGKELSVSTVFRAAEWDEVEPELSKADHIIFACVPIRSKFEERIIPYARRIINGSTPYSVLAAGTDMPVKDDGNFLTSIDEESITIVRELGRGAKKFTTRGILSQAFCHGIGIENSVYEGDVAFYYPETYGLDFTAPSKISRIVISDPHRTPSYLESLKCLIDGAAELLPKAKVTVALHGQNDETEKFCRENGIDVESIYKEPDNGLSIYDRCDLHVGYRVHAHVSALSRRVPSYLLEQDGRGADYGLSLSRKVSVPHFLQRFHKSETSTNPRGSTAAPQQILSIIAHDMTTEFDRFRSFGIELEQISRRAEATVREIVESI